MLQTELPDELIDTLNDIHLTFNTELALAVQDKVNLGYIEPTVESLWDAAYSLSEM